MHEAEQFAEQSQALLMSLEKQKREIYTRDENLKENVAS